MRRQAHGLTFKNDKNVLMQVQPTIKLDETVLLSLAEFALFDAIAKTRQVWLSTRQFQWYLWSSFLFAYACRSGLVVGGLSFGPEARSSGK